MFIFLKQTNPENKILVSYAKGFIFQNYCSYFVLKGPLSFIIEKGKYEH